MPARACFILALVSLAANAQTILTCQANANPLLVRGEGLTERMGDITLQCSGGQPNASITGNLSVFLSVPMTNRVDTTGYSDLLLSVDNGSGPIPANARAIYLTSASLSFSGVTFTLSPSGTVNIRLSNLRGAANQIGVNSARQITASLSFNGGALISLTNNVFSVATVVRSLYSSATSTLIVSGVGTPPIVDNSMNTALNTRAAFATLRVSEGFNSAFGSHSDFNFQNTDFGTRFIVRYTGVPAGVHLWLPDGVVGYNGAQPTSAGDYGLTPSPGVYSAGSLLLVRVTNADNRGGGSGSAPMTIAPAPGTVFDSLTEVPVNTDGTAQAIYEVVDANPVAVESATIPTFLYAPYGTVQTSTQITQDVTLAAASATLETGVNATLPRFVSTPAPNDCAVFGDCGASYFPTLAVSTRTIDVTLNSVDVSKTQFFTIDNRGAGNFLWNARVAYTGGNTGGYAWLRISPTSGINTDTVRLDLVPGKLPDGIYDAIITIDGGPIAGSAQIHVIMRFAYKAPTPVVINAVNAANLKPGAVVPGSAITILGDRLLGSKVTVTFDEVPARVLSANSVTQLDVQVPYGIGGRQYSLVVVTVDGTSSTPGLLMPIAVSAPAIYKGSVLNADNTSNNARNPALAGSIISVYSTGLPVAGVYSGKIHDRAIDGANLVYAGPAPTLIGVQLLSMIVPPDLPTLTSGVAVCGGLTVDTQVCSDFVDLSILGLPQP